MSVTLCKQYVLFGPKTQETSPYSLLLFYIFKENQNYF